ncbi:MAG: deoxyguanosinetriphosphate triphosphohydrolase [Pseudomonadota bacterium]
MLTRQELENSEDARLAPYAARASASRGRRYPEEPAPFRSDFQRDRDRIIHSTAFRRLEYKTQVFVYHEGDHFRTRLTHSLEVSQIGRTIARALKLNEDLMEALVLSHDLGHTPFGHAGERVMAELMKEHGGFEHNAQSLRVVDLLEHRYPDFPGLNLTFEVREGIIKHSGGWNYSQVPPDLIPDEQPSLEAQLIDLVDEIAYNNHDVDDGLSSAMIDPDAIDSVALWKQASEKVRRRWPSHPFQALKQPTISLMITTLVADLTEQTLANLAKHKISSLDDLKKLGTPIASFSPAVAAHNSELKKFLHRNMYSHYRVIRMEEKARRIIHDLFATYLERPEQLPREFADRSRNDPTARIVCDYIAGMTDRFAMDEHMKLFDPHTRV